jgi:hypothetical protein
MTEHNELTIDVRASGDAATVLCGGRLTITSASQLRVEVKRLLPHTRIVTIDLTNVTLMDSVGLGDDRGGLRVRAHGRMRTAGRQHQPAYPRAVQRDAAIVAVRGLRRNECQDAVAGSDINADSRRSRSSRFPRPAARTT